MKFNKHILRCKPYKLVSHEAWLLNDPMRVMKLDWNESPLLPSSKVNDALIEFINTKPLNWYPDVLNEQLLKSLSVYTGLATTNIQYFASSDSLHEYILRLFYNENANLTIVTPTYDNFRATAEATGYRLHFFDLNSKFQIDEIAFCEFLRSNKQDFVYLCSPNNPTGTEYSKDFIEKLASDFPETVFLIDEAYYEFGVHSSAYLVSKFKNILVSRTFSKAFGLASLRIGYLLANEIVISMVNKIRNPKSISSLAQVGAIAALADLNHLSFNVELCKEGKMFFINEIQRRFSGYFNIYFGGGNFVLLKILDINLEDFMAFLCSSEVFVRNLSHLPGLENHVRITVGNIETMSKLVKIFDEYFAKRS